MSLTECILRCVEGTKEEQGRKFIFIIDEWDAVIREAKDEPAIQKQYLDLLREWFKNIAFTPKAVAAAYMTGILPIKKDGSQSAISDFEEFTMIKPAEFIHPEDAAALRQLENIPGFPTIAKKVLELGYEKLKYGKEHNYEENSDFDAGSGYAAEPGRLRPEEGDSGDSGHRVRH